MSDSRRNVTRYDVSKGGKTAAAGSWRYARQLCDFRCPVPFVSASERRNMRGRGDDVVQFSCSGRRMVDSREGGIRAWVAYVPASAAAVYRHTCMYI